MADISQQPLQTVKPEDLDALIARAEEERWAELILLGPHYFLGDDRKGWPEQYRDAPRVFQATEPIGDDGARAIAGLTGLTSLDLGGNQIGDDGAGAIAGLTGLTSLDLGGNQIGDDGAGAIAGLTGLTSLDLGGNQIGDDGAGAIAGLTGLTSLNLGGNGIGASGARAIAGLTGLTSLDLGGNQIGASGARAIAGLTGLTSLNLGGNQIGDDGAGAIAGLTGLTSLNLGINQIGDDGAGAIASLTGLTALNLWHNGIGDDGARAIASLTGLTALDLWHNGIGDDGARAILDMWARRTDTDDLRHLNLRSNGDLSSLVPEEVLSNPDDPKAILAAYRRIKSGDRKPINEAKLLVVGNEAVGKTSLLRFLIHDKPRDPGEEKTPGIANQEKIEVEQWSPDAGGIRLNVWDFGGQEMMRGTHRFFLTSRSLYLLVLEDRREDDRSIYEWLKIIKNRGADSPILVVINKSDEGKEALRLPEAKLREEHPEIICFLRTSCNDDDFSRGTMAALKRDIVNAVVHDDRLKHVRDPFPASYLRVKEAIGKLAAKRDVLPITQFKQICTEGDQEKGRVTDDGEQRLLLNLLHDLGTIVAHGREPGAGAARREITLLDPNWLTESIYKILTSADCAELQGRFTAAHLDGWLDSQKYPKARHEFILDMMQDEEVGLCFALPGNVEKHFLVPEALPASPTLPPSWPADSLRFRYRYEFLPRGLVPRFIVQAHDLLVNEGARWRTGAVFEVRDCEILVEADVDQDQLDVQVKGPVSRRREALGVIRDRLESVHKQNREAAPTALVPLPDDPDNHEAYEHLLLLEDEEGPDYRHRPTGAKRSYVVSELLNGVRTDRPATRPRPANGSKPSANDATNTALSWRTVSAICAGAAAIIAALVLLQLEGLNPAFALGGGALAGVVTFPLVAYLNPDYAYRRLISLAIGFLASVNIGGTALNAPINSEAVSANVQWGGSVPLSFNITMTVVVIALISLEGWRMHKAG